MKEKTEDLLETRDTLVPGLEVSVTRSREETTDVKHKPKCPGPKNKLLKRRAPMKKQIKKAPSDPILSVYAPCDCNVTYTQSPDGSYVVNLSGTDFQGQIGGVTNIDTSLVKVKQGQRIGSAKGHLKIECDKNGEKPAQV